MFSAATFGMYAVEAAYSDDGSNEMQVIFAASRTALLVILLVIAGCFVFIDIQLSTLW